MPIVQSMIHPKDRTAEGQVNGFWAIEARQGFNHPAGMLVCDPALNDADESDTFTAKNGKRYMDTVSGGQWTPR